MTIIENKIIETWNVDTLLDFIYHFKAQNYFLDMFSDITDIQDVYESEKFIDD